MPEEIGCADLKQLFLTGASGRLGSTVTGLFHNRWKIIPCNRSSGADLRRVLPEDVIPGSADFVLNCAAVSSRAACLADPVSAFKLNALWPALLASFCAMKGKRLVHVSTDLVYSGGVPPYTESSPAVPRCFYGWTKLLGDVAVSRHNPDALTVRTSVLVGRAGATLPTFSEDILQGRATLFHVDSFRNHTEIEPFSLFLEESLESSSSGLVLAAAPYSMSRAAYAYSLGKTDLMLAPAPPDIPHDLTLKPSKAIGKFVK
jgi:dTDP-4-dehydrorhamnose reductase